MGCRWLTKAGQVEYEIDLIRTGVVNWSLGQGDQARQHDVPSYPQYVACPRHAQFSHAIYSSVPT